MFTSKRNSSVLWNKAASKAPSDCFEELAEAGKRPHASTTRVLPTLLSLHAPGVSPKSALEAQGYPHGGRRAEMVLSGK